MELKNKISRLIFAGFKGQSFADIEGLLKDYPLGGIIIFKRNIKSSGQLKKLIDDIKDYSFKKWGEAPLIGVDQEGGRVFRLDKPFTSLPSNAVAGRLKSGKLAYLKSRLIALELAATGFDLDFHPVLDINTNPENRVIGDRAFGDDPEIVSKLGAESIRGLHSAGIIAVGKHFPGHGNTFEDSHEELPVISLTLDFLLKREIMPFVSAIDTDVDAIMPAHIVYEKIDEKAIPATFSEKILTQILRGKLGFQGIIISDDLEMKAISDNFSINESTLLSVKAGVDMLLICHSCDKQIEAIESLEEAVTKKRIEESSIDLSLERIGRIKQKTKAFPKPEFPHNNDIEDLLNLPLLCNIRKEISEITGNDC